MIEISGNELAGVSPIAHWKLDEGSGTTAYDSAGSNDGTITGATWTTGKLGGALEFDGTNDYVNCGNDDVLDLTTSIKISVWLNLNSNSGRQDIVSREFYNSATDQGGYNLQYAGQLSPKRIRFVTRNNATTASQYNYSATGEWIHIAGVYNGTHNILYINGTQEDSDSSVGIRSASGSNLTISDYSFTVNGKSDDVRIYDRALSADEIERQYLEGAIAYWKLDDGSGTTAYDSAGSNDGTIYGATWTTGKLGGALEFDGNADYVSTGDLGDFPEITISWWRNVDPHTVTRRDIYDGYGATVYNTSSGSKLHFYLGNGTSWSSPVSTDSNIQADQWYHLAVTYDGSSITGYVNGVAQADTESYSETVNLNDFYISASNSQAFDGTLDEVRIYDKALSANEIEQLYDQGQSGPTYYFYHYDGLGSVVALSDSAGDTVQFILRSSSFVAALLRRMDATENGTYEYSVYGQVAASNPNHPNPYLFTGRRFDRETGLYYYRARYYNPYIGRFLQTDPVGYNDGINWYLYCNNNPLGRVDPSGLVGVTLYDPCDPGGPGLADHEDFEESADDAGYIDPETGEFYSIDTDPQIIKDRKLVPLFCEMNDFDDVILHLMRITRILKDFNMVIDNVYIYDHGWVDTAGKVSLEFGTEVLSGQELIDAFKMFNDTSVMWEWGTIHLRQCHSADDQDLLGALAVKANRNVTGVEGGINHYGKEMRENGLASFEPDYGFFKWNPKTSMWVRIGYTWIATPYGYTDLWTPWPEGY